MKAALIDENLVREGCRGAPSTRKKRLPVKTDTASFSLPRQYQPRHFLPLPFTLAA